MWSMFWNYYWISSILLIGALGSQWLEGLKFMGITFTFLIGRILWAAAAGPPKPLKCPAIILFMISFGLVFTLNSVWELVHLVIKPGNSTVSTVKTKTNPK